MEKKEGCFFGLFRPKCYSCLDSLNNQIVSFKYDLEIERQSRRFAEDEAIKLYEMNEELKEENEALKKENEALKKENSFAWESGDHEYNENIKAAELMTRYDELLQKLNELNEKMKEWLKL